MQSYDNEYSNGEITVTYEPKKCIHSEICAKGLAEVFRTSVIPWINLEEANTEEVISQIGKCPSKALSYVLNKQLAEVK